jgi:transaldolase
MPAYDSIVEEAIVWGRSHNGLPSAVTDRLTVAFGAELAAIVPGRVSTEVDADLSFDVEGTVAKARSIIDAYDKRGIPAERILIKIAATWEGIRAAELLQKESIDCNMTLVFSLTQAMACADAGAFLISPFVGRILDWHMRNEGKTYTPETDPGVLSVRSIYNYYKAHDIKTIVMGASFRSLGEIEALAGCDRLTIAPALLDALAKDEGPLARRLDPESAKTLGGVRIDLDEKTFRLMLNEDAMASEKLGEGIRTFARDLTALRELVSKRLEATP